MNILVTGVGGFIGSKTAELLMDQGHSVYGVDNLNDYYDVRLKKYRLHQLAEKQGASNEILNSLNYRESTLADPISFYAGNFSYFTADIEDFQTIDQFLGEAKLDAVINLAARAGVRYSMENPYIYMTTNADGTLNLLEFMRKRGISKFVLASTSSLYAGQPMPFKEDLPVNTPISPYAATKKAAEAMAYTYHHLYGIDVSVLRYFTVFGPAGRPDMAPYRFIKWVNEGTPITLYGDGEQARDFTYIDDIAAGTIKALQSTGYEIINLGGGNQPITINQIIAWIEDMLGKKATIDYKPFHKADMLVTYADIQKAGNLLDWHPQVSPQDGFRKTADWYLSNQEWLKEIPV